MKQFMWSIVSEGENISVGMTEARNIADVMSRICVSPEDEKTITEINIKLVKTTHSK